MRPRTSRRISPALSSTLMCFEAAASEMANGSRELADRPLAVGELAKHPPAGCVAERVKDGVSSGASSSTMWLNVSSVSKVNRWLNELPVAAPMSKWFCKTLACKFISGDVSLPVPAYRRNRDHAVCEDVCATGDRSNFFIFSPQPIEKSRFGQIKPRKSKLLLGLLGVAWTVWLPSRAACAFAPTSWRAEATARLRRWTSSPGVAMTAILRPKAAVMREERG